MSGELGGRAPVAQTTGTQGGANNNAETFICGLDGRVTVTFSQPAPAPEPVQVAKDQPEDCFAVPQRTKHWRDTLKHGGGLRWKRNGGTAR